MTITTNTRPNIPEAPRALYAELNAALLEDGTAHRIGVESWMTPEEAAAKYGGAWDWPVAQIRAERAKLTGRSFHVGAGQWLQVCPECPAETVTYGSLPVYYGIGPHMVEAHGAKVPGINVGILS